MKHQKINDVRGMGLFLAMDFGDPALVQKIISSAFSNGLVMDWFLFCPEAIRVAPPLIITEEQIIESASLIIKSINEAVE